MLRKTAIRVGSLNMNGFGHLQPGHPENKWRSMYKVIKQNRIGVLLLQETHLTAQRKQDIMQMFKGRIKILFSAHPDAPTRKEGVAIILNKSQVSADGAEALEIIPGRAMQVTVKACAGDALRVLCVYAPTSDGVEARRVFYQRLREYYEARPTLARPNLMAGDFNNVEDNIDRLPAANPDASLQELDALKATLGLMAADGWRATYLSEKAYTFHRGTGVDATCSRLDRIYVPESVFLRCREWEICTPAVKTDHSLVTVQVTTENAPTIGKGRPIFPLFLLKNKALARSMKRSGEDALRAMERIEGGEVRTESCNAQTILYDLKTRWLELARAKERDTTPRLLADIRELQAEKKRVQNSHSLAETARAFIAAKLTGKIRDLELKRAHHQQRNSKAVHRIDGERPSKYWTRLHKPCTPRDIILAFERERPDAADNNTPAPREYESDSAKMAEMARRHHDDLQQDERGLPQGNDREECIRAALESLDAKLSNDQAEDMGAEITYNECMLALRFSKSGTAPGKDGIPYEVWKTLNDRFIEDSRHENRAVFDVVKLLHLAIRDVQRHGVAASVPFAEGWMAPIYKEKGERTKVANYRPITLLNTDYKLLAKVLSIRLAEAAPTLEAPQPHSASEVDHTLGRNDGNKRNYSSPRPGKGI
ncbi:DNase I-like protein [Trametes coccinea BRFM310]|uniref:DNase I-like protein n=1 Tax=Trametes coccinea (strain BRFM310) TaxID=1353009 RepID=A0A1Y2IBM9_TRAC3|nr:DNase I-like protein [Trametes coccinea BRFM310]